MANQTPSLDLATVAAAVSETDTAPLASWNPPFCGDIDLTIKRDGSWWYQGTPIGREAMVRLFARVLWQEEGRYFLKTPVEKIGIQVEDVPFLVTELAQEPSEQGPLLVFTTCTGDRVVASEQHPLRILIDPGSQQPAPYLLIRFGMEGRLSRSVFYQLVALADTQLIDGRPHWVVSSGKARFVLGAYE